MHLYAKGVLFSCTEAAFDLTILVPKSNFGDISPSNGHIGISDSHSDNLDQYLYLSLPAGGADCIRDIKQTVAESAEGFWIGAHSFVRVQLKEECTVTEDPEPKVVIDGNPSEVLADTVDLAHVFGGDVYRNHEVRRALKVVESELRKCATSFMRSEGFAQYRTPRLKPELTCFDCTMQV